MKKIIATLLLISTYSLYSQRSNFVIINKKDTIYVSNDRSINSIIDSISKSKQKKYEDEVKRINDSIDYVEELQSLYSFYFLDTIRSNTTNKVINIFREIVSGPDDTYIKSLNTKIDTLLTLNSINYQILDSINHLREKVNSTKITLDTLTNIEYIEESIFHLVGYNKKPLMIREYYESCDCSCPSDILEYILSFKGIKRKILSNNTDNIFISILVDIEENYYIYLKISNTNYYLKTKL
jgi:hypothetical protein